MFSRQFLLQMAHDRELSPEQEEVFLLRFAEDKEYDEIAQLLQTSEGACLKRMGQVYNKFGIDGFTRGKENRLRIYLLNQAQRLGEEAASNGRGGDLAKPHSQKRNIFISYRSQEPDLRLAQQLSEALKAAGHQVFMAQESIRQGENWPQRIDAELKQCDYFVLLLCPQSAFSDMLIEELQHVKELRAAHNKPAILTIRVDFPLDSPLSYDLRSHLQGIPQREWRRDSDTPAIVQEILSLLTGTQEKQINSSSFILDPSHLPIAWETPDGRPLPVAGPEVPEGQVDLASFFYIERPPIESRCYEMILQPGALIRIKAPRQMGKTSLMARIMNYGANQGYKTVSLSFQLAERSVFSNLEQFLKWFCAYVGLELQLPNKLSDYWDDIFGSKVNCKAYFEKYLLAEIDRPLVLGLDEVDRIFQHPEIADDFFGLLRTWHEDSKKRDIWKKLRLLVVHSTEVYIPLDINQSPFNVGLPIELPEFSNQQVLELAQRYGLNCNADHVEELMNAVGGHPYLVRVALYHIARGDISLDKLMQTAPTEAGLYSDHLRRHLWNLQQHPELAAAMLEVVSTTNPVRLQAEIAFQLHSMGLVHLQGNDVKPRCDLYRRYFRERLGSSG
ncbi:AAA-like domain-containing protein [Aerosakkonema sp. BLCC-F183]|uniref:AAA-like domain-containing protein n=1 Tax=Aerosakkonema sp. BLCC-F183 TaxID=3342834 RepID=UPI0035B9B8B6